MESYLELLSGRLPVTDLLYNKDSLPLIEAINRNNPLADHFNALAAAAVREAAIEMSAREDSRPIAILEIGAGTGSTTASILQTIAPFSDRIEYYFTDISPAFVQRGRDRWSAEFPFTRYALLDIEKDFTAQGFAPGQFAIVCATNVLHATRNISATLDAVNRLLRPQGILILSEVCHFEVFATLTFGLTSGWWLFEDKENRIPHSPLLSTLNWRRCLSEQGFPRVRTSGLRHPEQPESYLQSLIVAQSTEKRLRPTPESPAPVNSEPATVQSEDFPVFDRAIKGSEAQVRQLMASKLDADPARLKPTLPFSDFGIDSIVSVEMAQALNEELGISLRSTDLFNYPTIRQLAAHIDGTFPARRSIRQVEPAINGMNPGACPDLYATPREEESTRKGLKRSPPLTARLPSLAFPGNSPEQTTFPSSGN